MAVADELVQEAISDALASFEDVAWDVSGEFSTGRIWIHDHASGRLIATLTVERPDDPEGLNL